MIDAAIPLQTQAPQITPALQLLNQAGNLQQQQQNLQTGAIKQQGDQLTLNQQQQSEQDQSDTRAAIAAGTKIDPTTGQPTLDRPTMLATLAKLNPAAAAQTATNLNAQDTAAAEAKAKLTSAQAAAVTAHLDLKDKLLQGVSDQPTWTNARNIAIQNGINPAELPVQYDPQFVAQAHAQTLSQQQAFQQQQEQATLAEKTAHDKAITDNTAATQQATAAYRQSSLAQGSQRLGIESERLNQENTGTVSIAQVPDGKGGMKSVLLNNKTGTITDTNPGLTKPSATQPPAGQPTTADRNRASLGQIALDNIDGIQDIVNRRADLFGPGAGRVSNIDQIIGSNDPDLVAVTNFAHNFSMANAGVHGSRSVQNVRDAVSDLLGDLHNGQQGIMGGLAANRKNLKAVIDAGKPPNNSNSAPGSAAPATGGAHPFFQQFGGTAAGPQ